MGICVIGQPIGDPMPIWRAYARKRPRTIREYDLGGTGAPNELTVGEAWRSRIINSRLTSTERDQFVARAAEAECPWDGVPEGSNLADADPAERGGLFASAARLYWYFTWPERMPGVAVAKVHKVLHVKRPAFYPILDGNVKNLYGARAEEWVGKLDHLDVTLDDSPPYWAAIRDDLICSKAQLDTYRKELAKDSDETVRLMASMSDLRLLDIVAWEVAN